MAVAIGTAHRDREHLRPTGAGELPVTNLAAALALATTGPGLLALDRLLGARVPRVVSGLTFAVAATSAAVIISQHVQRTQERQEQERQTTPVMEPQTGDHLGESDIDLRARAERTSPASS
jgi:hypothetical protein